MKKSLFIIAATALVISCANNDVKNDIVLEDIPIGFSPSFMEKSTKANAGEMIIDRTNSINTFNVDGNTFEVWGWKTNTSGTTKVFDNVVVEYDEDDQTASSTNWIYSPLKYWDRTASYKFYAAAPDNTFTLVEDDSDDANRKFSASNIPSVQTLQNKDAHNATSLIKLANAAANVPGTASEAIDYMVAAKVECAAGAANQSNNSPRYQNDKDVEFTFNHILSKLTVNVLTSDDFAPSGKPEIKLTELTMSLNGMAQSYAQATAGSVAPASDAWSSAITNAVTETCFYANAANAALGVDSLLLTATGQQVASYFVAPTATTSGAAEVKVIAKYTVFYADGVKENCVTPETTVENLTSFVQNNSYTLNIKIAPGPILFDVNVVNGFTPVTAIEQEVE